MLDLVLASDHEISSPSKARVRTKAWAVSSGLIYAELAGIERRPPRAVSKGWGSSSVGYHSYTYNGQGKAFNKKLGSMFGKPGRFLFKRVLRRKPEIEAKVKKVAEQFGIKLFAKLD